MTPNGQSGNEVNKFAPLTKLPLSQNRTFIEIEDEAPLRLNNQARAT